MSKAIENQEDLPVLPDDVRYDPVVQEEDLFDQLTSEEDWAQAVDEFHHSGSLHLDLVIGRVDVFPPEHGNREPTDEELEETRGLADFTGHDPFDSDAYVPRDRNEYQSEEYVMGVPWSQLRDPEHLANSGRRAPVLATAGKDDEDYESAKPDLPSTPRLPRQSLDPERMVGMELLFEGGARHGFHVVKRTGGKPGRPRRRHDADYVLERLQELLHEVGHPAPMEATSMTGNGKATDEAFKRAVVALAAEGVSYDEIHEVIGPTKNTVTTWKKALDIVEKLPPVE